MEWNGVGWSHIPLFGFVKKDRMKWDVMELIPSNTIHLLNFPFPQFWGVSNGMEHINNTLTIFSLFFLLFFFKIQTTSFFFVLSFSIIEW